MKTILLNNVSYNLVDSPNVSADRIQATILKEDYSVEDIVENAKGNEVITVKEDNEVIGVYNGYTDFMCAYLYNHDEDVVVSVEIANHDMQSQINNIHADVVEIGNTQTSQGSAIDSLNSAVSEITPYTETKKAYFGENEKTFYNVPSGNVLVFFDDYNGSYEVNRVGDRLIVSFDTLEKETNVTISIQ